MALPRCTHLPRSLMNRHITLMIWICRRIPQPASSPHRYYFVGRMIVLQPDALWHSFVSSEGDHPMLPPGPGLLYLADPAEMHLPPSPPHNNAYDNKTRSSSEAAVPPAPSSSPAPATRLPMVAARGRVPSSAHEAVMELMDCPHPLEMLADPNAYLSSGSISRYHNPDNYTLVSGALI